MRSSISRRRETYLAALLASALLAVIGSDVSAAAPAPPPPGPPLVTTGSVSHPRGATPVLYGTVNPGGEASTYYFQYGPTLAYGAQTASAMLPAGNAPVRVGVPVAALLPGEHYRLVATNASGTSVGKDHIYSSKSRSKFELPKSTAATVYGQNFILTGTLQGTGSGKRTLVLKGTPYPYKTPFVTIGEPVVTDATGHFAFLVPHMLTSMRLRVSTLELRPVVSRVFTQHVAVRVTLKVRSRGPKGLVRLYGTVTPAAVGAHVFVQLREAVHRKKQHKGEKTESEAKFSTKFRTTVKRGTLTVSRFSAVLTIAEEGRYRAYVVVGKGDFVAGASTTLVLSAKPGASTHKKKTKKKPAA